MSYSGGNPMNPAVAPGLLAQDALFCNTYKLNTACGRSSYVINLSLASTFAIHSDLTLYPP